METISEITNVKKVYIASEITEAFDKVDLIVEKETILIEQGLDMVIRVRKLPLKDEIMTIDIKVKNGR